MSNEILTAAVAGFDKGFIAGFFAGIFTAGFFACIIYIAGKK
jgi:hypothetical protein